MLPKLSVHQKLLLLERFSDPEDIFHTEKFDYVPDLTGEMKDALENKDLTQAQSVMKHCADKKISVLTIRDAGYPSRLCNIHNPPMVLYYKGYIPDLDGSPVIAAIGTRKASLYGLNVAKRIGGQLARCSGIVVSGMATVKIRASQPSM